MPAKKHVLGSDLKKIDRHVIQSHEYDEIPELTDDFFERADHYRGGKLVRRGRPKSDQSRIGDVLKRHVSRQSAARKKKAG
jgi:hypothetical protein